ncbi:hypothetical protein AB6A40_002840 [Gnathostoma spinigerum]|uniref:Leishmanolysin-like peptidase n=1 Tax=Gnathostoma spinigerum TaxID=75299 RepID=A0ABD6E936_9BILA
MYTRIFTELVLLTIVECDHWEPLNVALVTPKDIPRLPAKVTEEMRGVILEMRSLISVQIFDSDPMISKTVIKQCTKLWKPNVDLYLDRFDEMESSHSVDLSEGFDTARNGVNFVLFVQVNYTRCDSDNGLLASAAPCSLSENIRPLSGRLNICPHEDRWRAFKAVHDLFRHELLHALGFGLILPESSSIKSRKFQWNYSDRKQKIKSEYMDFSKVALNFARRHFACSGLRGIEAEDADKTHLSEYIFGNELMTPILSNEKNYFTFISASILEETKVGTRQWYKTNRMLILAETKSYWYGRKWGCEFVEKSCTEYISSRTNQSTFPFCNENDLLQLSLYPSNPKMVCFLTNTGQLLKFDFHCNAQYYLRARTSPTGLKAITLSEQFPSLYASKLAKMYGSDYIHRFCPFIQEVIRDRIVNIPESAIVVRC